MSGCYARPVQTFTDRPQTQRGPADWFTGTVWIDAVVTPSSPGDLRVARVSFEPGARTAWHTHPRGQALHILSGICQAQARGGPIAELKAGDSAWFAPGEVHWHGAKPGYGMVHLAMQQPDAEGKVVDWMQPVSEAEIADA